MLLLLTVRFVNIIEMASKEKKLPPLLMKLSYIKMFVKVTEKSTSVSSGSYCMIAASSETEFLSI